MGRGSWHPLRKKLRQFREKLWQLFDPEEGRDKTPVAVAIVVVQGHSGSHIEVPLYAAFERELDARHSLITGRQLDVVRQRVLEQLERTRFAWLPDQLFQFDKRRKFQL